MPKLKTHKGAKRRFHITSTGKVMHRKGGISHMRTRKSKRTKALVADKIMASDSMQDRVHRLMPYA